MGKKILSLLMALCLLIGAAAAEAVLLTVELNLGEDATLTGEQTVEGSGYMREYTLLTSRVYLMVMNQPVTADEMMGSLSTSNLQETTLIREEGGVHERRVYKSETDNMAVDVAVMQRGNCSVVLMLMSEKVTYEGANQIEWMTGWLEEMTIDGEPAATDIAAAMKKTQQKLAAEAQQLEEQLESGELVAIPQVGISFGGEGVLVNESGAENAYMQTYQVGDQTVFILAYLGEYLCDGVWQSMTFELPENELIAENENGIRQRKSYDYGDYTGDVSVVWNNGCTVAMVAVASDADYEGGMKDTFTAWLESMTINGVSIVPAGE